MHNVLLNIAKTLIFASSYVHTSIIGVLELNLRTNFGYSRRKVSGSLGGCHPKKVNEGTSSDPKLRLNRINHPKKRMLAYMHFKVDDISTPTKRVSIETPEFEQLFLTHEPLLSVPLKVVPRKALVGLIG